MGIIGSYQGYVDSPLYLYNNGAWSNLQTTGWVGEGVDTSNSRKFREYGKTSPTRYFIVACCLAQKVDLTNYNYIKTTNIRVTNQMMPDAGTPFIGISTTYGLTVDGSDSKPYIFDGMLAQSTNAFPTAILDISHVSGIYYVYVGMCYYLDSSYPEWGLEVTQLYLTTT